MKRNNKMSYSISYTDDYDLKEEGYDLYDEQDNDENDYSAQNQMDGSDEDTEEASETDMGRSDEPMEIKEQMYQDKLASLKKQLQQLKDGTHPELNRRFKRLEHQYKERLRLNDIHRDYMVECVERDYLLEKDAAAKEFKEKKEDLKETLINDFEDKRKQIEQDRHSMELTGDSTEVKPVMTRKLRRRPNDPAPVLEKRRKPPTAQLVLLLDEKEIESDLKTIARGKPLPGMTIGNVGNTGGGNSSNTSVLSNGETSRDRDRDGGRLSGSTPPQQQPPQHRGRHQGSGSHRSISPPNNMMSSNHSLSNSSLNNLDTTTMGSGNNTIMIHHQHQQQQNSYANSSNSISPTRSEHNNNTGTSGNHQRSSNSTSGGGNQNPAMMVSSSSNNNNNTSGYGSRDGAANTMTVETRVEDGKLLYERRWFHRGQPVYVEGQEMARCAGNISAINSDAIWIKKQDGSKFRICTSQLSRGKISIKRRAS